MDIHRLPVSGSTMLRVVASLITFAALVKSSISGTTRAPIDLEADIPHLEPTKASSRRQLSQEEQRRLYCRLTR